MVRELQNYVSTNPAFSGRVFPKVDLFLKPADRDFPLKPGHELFVDAPDAEADEKMQFRFEIAFGEPQIAEGEPLLDTLHQTATSVEEIVTSFRRFLA